MLAILLSIGVLAASYPILLWVYIIVGGIAAWVATALTVFLPWDSAKKPVPQTLVLSCVYLFFGSALISGVMAFPSSFVALYGCRAGHEHAYYAMFTIPWLAAGAFFSGHVGELLSC